MALNTDKMPQDLMDALTKRGWSQAQIENMDAAKAFDEFCQWHGLLGWGPELRSAMETFKHLERSAAYRAKHGL